MKRKVLFIDRDGTIITEPPVDFQVDSLEKLEFVPKVIRNLYFIRKNLDFKFVMVTNQDGLGTGSFPEETFHPVHNFVINTFKGEGVEFDNILIDRSFPEDNKPTRKPGTAMLTGYMTDEYDLERSYVIGDRLTDVKLALNLGAKAIFIGDESCFKVGEDSSESAGLRDICALVTRSWDDIFAFLRLGERTAIIERKTAETDISIYIDLDGNTPSSVFTGLNFFDHMLDQISRHSGISLNINVKGDLNVDEHHTIEDTGIALGEAILKALGSKRGIERYGFVLPMDDCLATVVLDFGGRSWLVWDVEFNRERIGDVPTEMFFHFFKSLSDSARMNLNIKAEGSNEHHKAEGIFKAFAKAIKMAIRQDPFKYELPSTKGLL